MLSLRVNPGARLCGVILVLAPFDIAVPRDGFTPLVFRPLLLVTALLAVAALAVSKGRIDRHLAVVLAALVLSIVVAALVSEDRTLGLAVAARFFVFGLVAVAASKAIKSAGDVRILLSSAAVAGVVSASVGLLVLWNDGDLAGTGSLLGSISSISGVPRLTRPFSHANIAAMFLGPIVALLVARLAFSQDERQFRTRLLFGAVLASIALSATLSRGGNLALLAALVLVAGWAAVGRGIRRSLVPLAFAVSLMVAMAVVPAWSGRTVVAVAPGQTAESLRVPKLQPLSRPEIWGQALDAFAESPVAGVGPGQFGTYSAEHTETGIRAVRHAHNLFLEPLATGGVLVAVPFVALLVLVSRRALRSASSALHFPLVAALTAAGLHGLVDYPLAFFSSSALIALLVGAMLGLDTSSGPDAAGQVPRSAQPIP